jgi:NADH-ubiquinone oxidoreductase chain 5
MLLSIIFLPLLSVVLCAIFGRFIGKFGVIYLTTMNMWVACLLSYLSFFQYASSGISSYINLGSWISLGYLNVNWGFQIDGLTVSMLIVVTTVAALVHSYSSYYMKADPFVSRFFMYLSFFAFFMLILVSADNFVVLFLGWEGVGLCSYLLINFWFTRLQANKAAIKAIMVNRVGDFCLLVAMGLIYSICGSLDFATVFSVFDLLNYDGQYQFLLDTACLFLLLGAVGKSAQLGLHTWLPDAMEGPTPVSALIHAATMVTAGIFLVIRCSFLFENSPSVLVLMAVIGSATAFFAGSIGLVQNDIKKVIAYSTCSQLGYMLMICGLSQYSIGFFHLFNHAFFKALLFLTAGSIIHALSDEQDIRKMGGLVVYLKFFYTMVLIGSLALAGFPYLSGFYSKDLILESAAATYSFSGQYLYFIGVLAAALTAFYSFRLIYFIFYTRPNMSKVIVKGIHSPSYIEIFVLSVLAFGSLFSGYLIKDMFIGPGSSFFINSVFTLPENNNFMDSEFLPIYLKLLPTILSFSAIFLVFRVLPNGLTTLLSFYYVTVYKFLNSRWYFNTVYNFFIAKKLLDQGHAIFWIWDKYILEQLKSKN